MTVASIGTYYSLLRNMKCRTSVKEVLRTYKFLLRCEGSSMLHPDKKLILRSFVLQIDDKAGL